MRGSAPSPSRWRFEALLLALALGCSTPAAAPPDPVAVVDGYVLDQAVIDELVAREPGRTEDEARRLAIETLRLRAAGREQQRARSETVGLAPRREQQLRRAALARRWLRDAFEPSRGPEDIPDDHPRLKRARVDPMQVHPELSLVCQAVIGPPRDVTDREEISRITADPSWRAAAEQAMAPIERRVQQGVPPGDPDACQLFADRVGLSDPPDDPRLAVTMSKAGGFDLDACGEKDEQGRCTKPTFAPEWTSVVREMAPGQFAAPFFSRFGLHLVYLHQRLPSRPADDPATEAALRADLLPVWRAEQLDEALATMGQQRAVRIAPPTAEAP